MVCLFLILIYRNDSNKYKLYLLNLKQSSMEMVLWCFNVADTNRQIWVMGSGREIQEDLNNQEK